MAWPLIAGIAALAGGGVLEGNAADAARSRLEDVALTPGLDVDAETLNALMTMEKYLPRAKGIGSSMTDYSRGEIEKSMEAAMPGYAKRRTQALANVDDWLAGKLSPETTAEIYRNTAGRAIGGGYSGTGFHGARVARDLGLSSLALQQSGLNALPGLNSAFPAAQPFDISQLAGLSPTQLINLRSQERAQKMALMAQQSQLPGQTAVWGNKLSQMGGMLLGAGLMGGGGGGASAGTGMTIGQWQGGMGGPNWASYG